VWLVGQAVSIASAGKCDKLITVAPLQTDACTEVSLSVKNYLGIAPSSRWAINRATEPPTSI
jgi:hypothetical protein